MERNTTAETDHLGVLLPTSRFRSIHTKRSLLTHILRACVVLGGLLILIVGLSGILR